LLIVLGENVMRLIPFIVFILCLNIYYSNSVSAHSGNTDANGGHKCHTCGDGSYHYHNAGNMVPTVYDSELRNSHYYTDPKKEYNFTDMINYPFGLTYTPYLILIGLVAVNIIGMAMPLFWKNKWSFSSMKKGSKVVVTIQIAFCIAIIVHAITLPKIPNEISKEFLIESIDTYFALQDLEVPNEVSPNPYVVLTEPLITKTNILKKYFNTYEDHDELTNKEIEIYEHLYDMRNTVYNRLKDNDDKNNYEKYFIHKKKVVKLLGLNFTKKNSETEEIILEDDFNERYENTATVENSNNDSDKESELESNNDTEEVEENSEEHVIKKQNESENGNSYVGTFTLGSTQEEVKHVMGVPSNVYSSDILGDRWNYGSSLVEFDTKGKVRGWSNWDENLMIFLGEKQSNANPFSLNSSKKEVIDSMGTPDFILSSDILGDRWKYGSSEVEFDTNGRVRGWSNWDSNLLLTLGQKITNASPFTIGSSKQQVINAMGTPEFIQASNILGDTWRYGSSNVKYGTNGKVEGWNDWDHNLKVE
jgi:hypothetical protein